jgi:predicted oxidoreductase
MDPLSIARFAITLASACKNLYLFLKKVKDGDPTVIALRKEIKGLESTVEAVRGVADSSLVNTLVARQWKNVHDIMADCEECVTSLSSALGKPDNRQHEDILQRIWKQWKIGLKEDDLTALQTQMASNRQNLTLSLQVIIL